MQRVLREIVGGVLLLAFFISTLFISTFGERIFVSPDENAAFLFAKSFAETRELSLPEPLNIPLQGLLHPRSMVGIGSAILPGSFIGLPIVAGGLIFLFGEAAALLLTPFLALFAILAWRKTIESAFQNRLLGDLSAFFLMVHPAFWYYSGRVMMHNVAFISFLIFAAYIVIASPFKELKTRFSPEVRQFELFLSGLSVGVALFMRTAELPWVLLGFFVLLFTYRAQLGWRSISAALLGLAVMAGVIGYTNNEVYGAPYLTGYTIKAEVAGAAPEVATVLPTVPEQLFSYLLPFGIHPRAIMRHELYYELYLYPWMTLPAIIGFFYLIYRKFEKQKAWKVLSVGTVLLAFWLGAVYGSWSFNDNPDPNLITLGNSYVRYWLPLFVLSTPLAAYVTVALLERLNGRQKAVIPAVLVCLTLLSAHLVFFGHDGIMKTRSALHTFLEKRREIFPLTERDAIIVVDRSDKYLFPYRRVVTPLRDEKTYAALPAMVEHVPVYYFGITLPEKDMAYLNSEKLFALGLRIEYLKTMDDESLYRISKQK
jgi:hypothetical protein